MHKLMSYEYEVQVKLMTFRLTQGVEIEIPFGLMLTFKDL